MTVIRVTGDGEAPIRMRLASSPAAMKMRLGAVEALRLRFQSGIPGGPGPQGVQGEQGPQGPQGEQGESGDAGTDYEVWVEMFGAVGDGVTDDTAAIVAALAEGKHVNGLPGKTYAVSGDITLPDRASIRDLSLKQLTPSATRKTLVKTSGSGPITLERVTVDRNGTIDALDPHVYTTTAAIWLQGVNDIVIRKCEITGHGKGVGIRVITSDRVLIEDNYIHDMTFYHASDPGTEQLAAMSIENSTDIRIKHNRIRYLKSKFGVATAERNQTDGINVGGSDKYFIEGNIIHGTNEAIDVTGSAGNDYGSITDNMSLDAGACGVKVANGNKHTVISGNIVIYPGWLGIAVTGNSEASLPLPQNFVITNNLVLNPGRNTYWVGQTKVGIEASAQGFDADYPRSFIIDGNMVVDDANDGGATMQYGIWLSGANAVTRKMNLGSNTIRGFTTAPVWEAGAARLGPEGTARVRVATTPLSIPTGAWTTILWNSETEDATGMYSGGTFTAPLDGLYSIKCSVLWAGNATGIRQVRVLVNGGYEDGDIKPAHADGVMNKVVFETYIQANQTIVFQGWQTSGGALNISADPSSSVQIRWIRH